jgi:putative transposase
LRTSLGRIGVRWDNAAAESFFAALKNEMYHRHCWPTRARARFAVAEYIEVCSRPTPAEFEPGLPHSIRSLTDHRETAAAAA